MVRDSLKAGLWHFNSLLQRRGLQPLVLLGDSKTMEDLLQKLSDSPGHSRVFITDEGVRKFQELGQYKPGDCCRTLQAVIY